MRRHAEVDEREARENPGTVATLPARDEDALPEAHVVGYFACCATDTHPGYVVGRRTVVEGHPEDRVTRRHRGLVFHGREHDDFERHARDGWRGATLREPTPGEEVVIVGTVQFSLAAPGTWPAG